MNVLVACEYSGRVREAFRAFSHDTYSCDLLPSEDNSPYHIQGDVVPLLTAGWDLLIAHPPCTYLANSGIHWNGRVPGRAEQTEQAVEFVRLFADAPIPHKAIENPIGVLSKRLRKPDQIIQPYDFGEDASKSTCLWLWGLPKLQPTGRVNGVMGCKCGHRFSLSLGAYGCPNCCGENGAAREVWGNQTPTGQNNLGPSEDRWKERSRTYLGIAYAMAWQWSNL